MKLAMSFLAGVLFCSMLLFGIQFVLPARAQIENSNSGSFSLVDLLPDIEKIYEEALITPFIEAEKKIYDDDIARFYRVLLSKMAFDKPPAE